MLNVYTLKPGPLLQLIAPGQTTTNLTITPSGALISKKHLCTLHQAILHISTNTTSSTLLIIGILRKCLLLTSKNGHLKFSYFLLPGNKRLTTSALHVNYTNDITTITDFQSSHTVSFANDPPVPLLQSPHLRLLLRAVNQLTDHAKSLETISTERQLLITSHNTFLSTPPTLSTPVLSPFPTTDTLVIPTPITGKTVYLHVTSTTVLPGWFIRCTITKSQQHPKSSLTTVITLPLQQTTAFPYPLSSHAPITVTLDLLFHRITTHVSTTLLDILQFSHPLQHPLPDQSHQYLSNVYLKSPTKPRTITLRLHLPLPRTALLPHQGAFQTPLKASYNIIFEPVIDTAIIIHASVHVAPFVRAALLRRALVLDHTPPSLSGTEVAKWKRRIADNMNTWLPTLRTAETALVHVNRVYERLEKGAVEERSHRGDEDAFRVAVHAARKSYVRLRSAIGDLWTPA